MTKPSLGIDLLLNTALFICQLLGKLQPFLIVFNSQFKRFACFVRILGFPSLFKITTTKPSLDPNFLLNAVMFIC